MTKLLPLAAWFFLVTRIVGGVPVMTQLGPFSSDKACQTVRQQFIDSGDQGSVCYSSTGNTDPTSAYQPG